MPGSLSRWSAAAVVSHGLPAELLGPAELRASKRAFADTGIGAELDKKRCSARPSTRPPLPLWSPERHCKPISSTHMNATAGSPPESASLRRDCPKCSASRPGASPASARQRTSMD